MSYEIIRSFEIEREDREFTVEIVLDDWNRKPWEDDCGVGKVSDWETRPKRAGEMVLNEDGGSTRFYDFAGTMAKARRDGWGLSDENKAALAAKLGREPTAGEITQEAVMRDFRRLRAWCNDEWHYVGVVVRCEETEEQESLWAIESGDEDYQEEVANNLADEILAA